MTFHRDGQDVSFNILRSTNTVGDEIEIKKGVSEKKKIQWLIKPKLIYA
jgi:hypothetical protein